MTIGRQLRARRLALGLSLVRLSALSGVEPASRIALIERGERKVRSDTLVRLADALGCDLALTPRQEK